MNRFKRYLQSHPAAVKLLIFGYIVFAGCFVFPFGSERFPFDFMKAYLVIASYGIIGSGLAEVYGAKREKVIYPITLGLTAIGMLCRYLLEFGEVSNTWNFTLLNIALYILVVPVFTVVVYHFIVSYLIKNS